MRGVFPFLLPCFPSCNINEGISPLFPFLAATIVGAGPVKFGAMSVTISFLIGRPRRGVELRGATVQVVSKCRWRLPK
jgi:hypothetical protein